MNADLVSVVSEPLHNSLDLEHNAHDATRINVNDDNEKLRYCRGCLYRNEQANQANLPYCKVPGIAETSSVAEKGTRARVGVCSRLLTYLIRRTAGANYVLRMYYEYIRYLSTTRYSTCATRWSCGRSASCPAILHVSRPFSSVYRVRSTCQQHSGSSHAVYDQTLYCRLM